MFLNKGDYFTRITETNLDDITEDDETILDDVEVDVIEEMSGYLRQRFDVALIFVSITLYDFAATYVIGDLVFIDADDFDVTVTYSANDLVVFNDPADLKDKVFAANAATPPAVGESPDDEPTKWDLQGKQYAIFTAVTTGPGNLLDDTDDWAPGDPRNKQIVRYVVDISLYEALARIKPRDISTIRVERRSDAIQWLQDVADPRKNITPNLPLVIHPDQTGNDISWDSNDKLTHDY